MNDPVVSGLLSGQTRLVQELIELRFKVMQLEAENAQLKSERDRFKTDAAFKEQELIYIKRHGGSHDAH